MSMAPIARIVLRYLIGGVIFGSVAVGQKLAADPDLVMAVAAGLGIAVEGAYALAKRYEWST